MFSATPMHRVKVIILAKDELPTLRGLGELGAVHLTPTELGIPPAPPTQPAPADTALVLKRMELGFEQLLKRRHDALERLDRASTLCRQMAPYRELPVPPTGSDESAFLHIVAGSLPLTHLAFLKETIGNTVALFPLPPEKDRQPLVALTTREGRSALDAALKQAGFRHEPIADTDFEKAEHNRATAEAELDTIEAELRTLRSETAPLFSALLQSAESAHRLSDAQRGFSRTDTTVLITGWVPASHKAAMEERVRDLTGGRYLIQWSGTGGIPENAIPVLLNPPAFLKSFARLVEIYGLPGYRDVEPTVLMALSYLLMFGMMFGDVGHGALLAGIGLIVRRTGRPTGTLLLFAGCSSIVFGALYGSWFGIPAMKPYALWHDPVEGNPMALMLMALAIGGTMISLGLVLNIINRFRSGDIINGWLDRFGIAGAVFYWGGLALLAKYAVLKAHGLAGITILCCLVLPLICISLKEPLEYAQRQRAGHHIQGETAIGVIAGAIVGALEAMISFLANTVSFMRLAAYAMSHAALLTATFMIVDQAQHAGGQTAGIAVAVAGNLVAILLEGFIAAVQALRLEYYEFFGKFLSGTGLPFKPFRLTAVEPGASFAASKAPNTGKSFG